MLLRCRRNGELARTGRDGATALADRAALKHRPYQFEEFFVLLRYSRRYARGKGMNIADADVRRAAFAWLEEQVDVHGDALPRSVLEAGFNISGNRIRLVGPQGIFKPATLALPIAITTVAGGPYADSFGPDGLLLYKYRGDDPRHRDNVGLRELMRQRIPLAYFHGIGGARYVPIWPVFIVNDSPSQLTFTVAVDDAVSLRGLASMPVGQSIHDGVDIRRGYITGLAKRRIHQQAFRERVLRAYRQQCALCRLRHEALLDAAHIVPDSDPDGEPVTSNGIALCKIHHAAFDRHFLSVKPDYRVEIRGDLLDEVDGPMLKHALQGLHGQSIIVPRDPDLQPNREFLERRHQRFVDLATRLHSLHPP